MNTLPTNVQDTSAYPPGYGGRMEPAQYGVYDKPADRRLAPWITLGSLLLGVSLYTQLFSFYHSLTITQAYGVLLIIFTFIDEGTVDSLWAFLVSGIILASVAILGFLAGTSRRSQLAGLFFWAFVGAFIACSILLIINAARLDVYMDDQCADNGFTRETTGCQEIREYRIFY